MKCDGMTEDRGLMLETPKRQIFEFLKEKGWNVFFVGNSGVVRNPTKTSKHSMWFIMEFIGSKDKKQGD